MYNNILSDFVCSNKTANCIQEKVMQIYKGTLPDYTVCDLHNLTKSTDLNLVFEDLIKDADVNNEGLAKISTFFITEIAGLFVKSKEQIDVRPNFIDSLEFAQAHLQTNIWKISVHWRREKEKVYLNIYSEGNVNGKIVLPEDYIFTDGTNTKSIESGELFAQKRGDLYENS